MPLLTTKLCAQLIPVHTTHHAAIWCCYPIQAASIDLQCNYCCSVIFFSSHGHSCMPPYLRRRCLVGVLSPPKSVQRISLDIWLACSSADRTGALPVYLRCTSPSVAMSKSAFPPAVARTEVRGASSVVLSVMSGRTNWDAAGLLLLLPSGKRSSGFWPNLPTNAGLETFLCWGF